MRPRVAGVCLVAAALALALAPAQLGPALASSGPVQEPATTSGPAAAQEALETQSSEADALAAVPAPPGAAEGDVVVAYYCHVTFRCETCLTAERLISDLLRTDFAGQLEAKSLIWQPLDYEQPENEVYAEAFGLESGPALVLGRWREGRLVEWHEVLEIWDHADDASGLIEVTRDRLKLFLQAEKWRAVMDSTRAANAERSAQPDTDAGTATDTQKGR
jgi:hypothetical protein